MCLRCRFDERPAGLCRGMTPLLLTGLVNICGPHHYGGDDGYSCIVFCPRGSGRRMFWMAEECGIALLSTEAPCSRPAGSSMPAGSREAPGEFSIFHGRRGEQHMNYQERFPVEAGDLPARARFPQPLNRSSKDWRCAGACPPRGDCFL